MRGDDVKSKNPLTSFCLAIALVLPSIGAAQTYDLGGASPEPGQESKKQVGDDSEQQKKPDFSWGAGIDVARQARAAQDALKRNDYAAAVSYAQQAANSAPQNAELWFLLGYAARLNEKYSLSVDSYNRGLKQQPESIRGLAGLAQTYAKMGRDQEAEQLLRRVIDANPKDASSLQLAGELLLGSDPKVSLTFLQRAAALQPSPHTDLLIAHAYDRMGQPEESARYLNRARSKAPHDPEVLRAVAGQFRDQGKYDEAISTLQSIPTKTSDIQAELAYTFGLAGKQQESAALYSRIAKAAKGNIGLNLSAAQAWVNAGRPEEAQQFLDAAKQLDANHYRLHAILAGIADSENRTADAEQEYRTAISNLPLNVAEGPLYPIELRLNLYELYTREGDETNAKDQLSSAFLTIQHVNVPEGARPEMLRLRAAIESASGDLESANRDLKDALALSPNNVNSLTNFGNLQWKMGQKDAARDTFTKILEIDRNNRQSLSALGYLARDAGDAKLAESYFSRAMAAHPKDFAPYLALGDLHTAEGKFKQAGTDYENAYQRLASNPLIVAGAANAAMESHDLNLAQRWLQRASPKMNASPQVQREKERFLTFKGQYEESAKLGYSVLEKLPHDREGVVYLAYDLYYLGRLEEALALVNKYEPVIPNDKDLPLIAGNVYAHDGNPKAALENFTLALERDPKMTTGYVNRGFVLNDLREAEKATQDFQTALKLQPDNGRAHLGLAFADLQLRRPKPALTHLDAAQKILGNSRPMHLARAEAFRQEQDFPHAAGEYRIALTEDQNDLPTELAYADSLYRMRRYDEATEALNTATKLSPSDSSIYALRAQIFAKQGKRDEALRDIESAERFGGNRVETFTATGEAFLALGDTNSAMQRFSRALDVPGGDRIGIRLSIAQIFLHEGHYDEAERQIALGFAEARLSPASPVKGEDFAEAGNLFLAMHNFDLAETYFNKAQLAGANRRTVALGLTNTYLAEGNTAKAGATLAHLGPADDYRDDYDYMMASANLYRQKQDPLHSLASFAQASTVAGEEDQGIAETSQYAAADQEGRPITNNLSVVPEANFGPVLEDINVYTLDARMLKVTDPAMLPPPRHSFQSLAESHYRVHLGNLPAITGFVGEAMTSGRLLYPSVGIVQDRHTYDTILNGGISPVLRFGQNSITFNGGLQFTVRRDSISPVFMNQNLFRQFLYLSTNSFFNWVAITGSAQHETGPFLDQNLHSRDLFANIEFTVGRPWGSTSLITGYSVRDLLFRPAVQEYFNTTAYVGLQHKFGRRLTAAVLAEDLRSWRVQTTQFAIAQALLPGGRFDFRATPRWSVQGSFVMSRGMGYHAYDNVQSEFLVSYTRAIHGNISDGGGEIPVAYPMRFSFGVRQQTFYDFPGSSTGKSTVLPIVHFTLF